MNLKSKLKKKIVQNHSYWLNYKFRFMMCNATFNNISVISWPSVLLVEETRVPRKNN